MSTGYERGCLSATNQFILDTLYDAELALRRSTTHFDDPRLVLKHQDAIASVTAAKSVFLPMTPTHQTVHPVIALRPIANEDPRVLGQSMLHATRISVEQSAESGWCWDVRNGKNHVIAHGAGYPSRTIAFKHAKDLCDYLRTAEDQLLRERSKDGHIDA